MVTKEKNPGIVTNVRNREIVINVRILKTVTEVRNLGVIRAETNPEARARTSDSRRPLT